jgi:hypothetical protein
MQIPGPQNETAERNASALSRPQRDRQPGLLSVALCLTKIADNLALCLAGLGSERRSMFVVCSTGTRWLGQAIFGALHARDIAHRGHMSNLQLLSSRPTQRPDCRRARRLSDRNRCGCEIGEAHPFGLGRSVASCRGNRSGAIPSGEREIGAYQDASTGFPVWVAMRAMAKQDGPGWSTTTLEARHTRARVRR